MASSEVFFMGIVIGIIIWFFVIVTLLYIFISKFLIKSFKIVRLDNSKSIRLMKLAESIK
jgi:hypothetical protein